jgi:hypothetical protein
MDMTQSKKLLILRVRTQRPYLYVQESYLVKNPNGKNTENVFSGLPVAQQR